MNSQYLIEMANRIGEFFAAYPNAAEGEREIADHLKRFWEPRMRSALLAHIDAGGGEGLAPLVLHAVMHHRALLTPVQRQVTPVPSLQPVQKPQR